MLNNSSDFTRSAEDFAFANLLKTTIENRTKDTIEEDVRLLLIRTLNRLQEARELILNIPKEEDCELSVQNCENENESESEIDRKRKSQLRRQKLMTQMSQMQTKFAMENAKDLQSVENTPNSASSNSHFPSGFFRQKSQYFCAVGQNRTQIGVEDVEENFTCILCEC